MDNGMKAIFEIGGKQYIHGEGDVFLTERVPAEVGEVYTVDKVLTIIDGDSTIVGKPAVEGAKIDFKVLNHGKGKKVIIQKFRPKENYRIRKGHRQQNSQLQLMKIHAGK
jgi:large subunit ribosomal protein L21